MDKPMGGPAEAPYAPPRVDPGALPFIPMFSESTMLGEHTAPAGSMREGHATTDLRSLTVQMSHAAQDPPTTTTAHAVYAEEEIQSQTMQGRTMGSADGVGRGHPGGNLLVKDPNTGIWTAGGASPSRIPNPMGSGPTGPHSMEERDVRGVYSHPPAIGGIRLGGVVAADVGDAIRINVFASRDAPLLQKCRRHWHRGDSAWHRHCGLKEWGPMYWHGSLDNTRRTVEKIVADRAKGILVITGIGSTPCLLWGLKWTLDSITLNEMSFGPEAELFIHAKGVPMPSPGQAWGTKAFLVDGAQAQRTGDEALIRSVQAVPMRVMFEPKAGTDQLVDGIDVLSHAEIDDVVNYMRRGMHDRVAAKKRRAMVTSPHWWHDKMLVTGKYEKDEFVARVMDHIADQYDGPVGSDPPMWDFPRMGADSDKNQADAANFQRLSVGSAPHDNEDGISDEEKSDSDPEEAYTAVRSVVSIPKQAAEEAQESPKVAELKERLINAYPRLFSGVANKNPPDRGRFGTAKIKLKPNPKIYRHREYQLWGDRAEAMRTLLAEFIERGWIEPSDSEWASPAFIVPKKEKGEWRLVVDYRGFNEQTEHDSYSLPLIDTILQKQQKKRIFTVLDLKHGYHQMPLHPDSRPCTAMSTPLGPMQWKVVPMGAKNGNAALQRMMEDLLGPVRNDPFVDDNIIRSGTEDMTEDELIEAHEKDLRPVLSELDKHNMVCKPTKASLFVKEVEFAGHVVVHG